MILRRRLVHLGWVGLALWGGLAGTVSVARAQAPAVDPTATPQPRFGVPANLLFYPQATPQQTLSSTIKALEQGNFRYFAAHLLDPAFLESQVQQRAQKVLGQVEQELRVLRDQQRRDPGVPAREQLSQEPSTFAQAVQAEATLRGFGLVVQDLQAFWSENPEQLRQFQKYLREATFTEAGERTTASLRGFPREQLGFVRVQNRFFVQNQKKPTTP